MEKLDIIVGGDACLRVIGLKDDPLLCIAVHGGILQAQLPVIVSMVLYLN